MTSMENHGAEHDHGAEHAPDAQHARGAHEGHPALGAVLMSASTVIVAINARLLTLSQKGA